MNQKKKDKSEWLIDKIGKGLESIESMIARQKNEDQSLWAEVEELRNSEIEFDSLEEINR